jgi:AraC-like DNA-binding protein
MTSAGAQQQQRRRRGLVERLTQLSAPAGVWGTVSHGSDGATKVFGYCVRQSERIARMRLEHPTIVVVLSGTKEVWHGDVVQTFAPGMPFLIPAGMELDVVNIPDERRGRYESICITVDEALRRTLRGSANVIQPSTVRDSSFGIDLTDELVEAFGHAASALSDPTPAVAAAVARTRILEILLLMSAAPAAAMLTAVGPAEQVEAVIYSDPARAWQVSEVAERLGVGASTLRRLLKGSERSFREILLAVRMDMAASLLGSSRYTVTQAAQAAGYASRSHFARRMRAAHGVSPRELMR